ERIPFRLAAPFRAAIDPEYKKAQSATTQTLLHQQFDQLQASSLSRLARDLRTAGGNHHSPTALYRTTENLFSVLKQEAPQVLPRLARFLYWHIPQTGPDAIGRYRRVFGAPPDDRDFQRIQAVAYERNDGLADAHDHWRAYEAEIAGHPEVWPGEQGK